jgi:hypothetical protein
MVRQVYAHLGNVRHRSQVVEFRLEQQLEALKDRLGLVGFGTTIDTAGRAGEVNETPAITQSEAGGNVPEWARRDSNARPLAPEACSRSLPVPMYFDSAALKAGARPLKPVFTQPSVTKDVTETADNERGWLGSRRPERQW